MRRVLLGLLLVVAALMLVLFFPDFANQTRSLDQLNNFAHVPLFAAVMAGVLLLWPWDDHSHAVGRALLIGRQFCIVVLVGGLVEMLQAYLGRTPELADVARDAAGAMAVILVALSIRQRPPLLWRGILRLSAAALVLAFLLPTLLDLADEAAARRMFPVLADLESPLQLRRFRPVSTAAIRERDPDGGGRRLRAVFSAGEYPRIELRYFPRDWRGHHAFAFTCINPTDDPARLFLRIDDVHHDRTYKDRYNVTLTLGPGRHEVEIPLDEVEHAPSGRLMDMAAIRSLNFYLFKLERDRELIFDDFRLLAAGEHVGGPTEGGR